MDKYVDDPRGYDDVYTTSEVIRTSCSASDACGISVQRRAARIIRQVRDRFKPIYGKLTQGQHVLVRGHPAMPAKAIDGERWIIDRGSGFHLVGDKALADKGDA